LIGKNLAELKDAEGKLFVQKMIEVAKKEGKGWVDYQWTNPVTKKLNRNPRMSKSTMMFSWAAAYINSNGFAH